MAGGMADEKWLIEKPDGGKNWSMWKFQMRHLLLLKGLWGIVEETDVPADGAKCRSSK